MCLCVYHMYASVHRVQGSLHPLGLELQVVLSHVICMLGTEPGSALQEQRVLLTTEPFHSQSCFLYPLISGCT